MIDWFLEERKAFYDRIRDLITKCEVVVPANYRYEDPYDASASCSLMRGLLGQRRLLRELVASAGTWASGSIAMIETVHHF